MYSVGGSVVGSVAVKEFGSIFSLNLATSVSGLSNIYGWKTRTVSNARLFPSPSALLKKIKKHLVLEVC